MNRLDFEIMRAENDLKSIEERLDRAVETVGRRTAELAAAVARKAGIACYASNAACAIADVATLGGERESVERLIKTLLELKHGSLTLKSPSPQG